jgi:hypothetical protein
LRVVTNQRLIRSRALLGRWCTILGFAALIGGFAYSTFGIGSGDPTRIFLSYACLVAGYVLITVGKGPWLRFAVHPRPDEALAINLKTLDSRNLLFNYISALPVDHLLFTPGGLIVIETRPFIGEIAVNGERWRRRRGVFGWFQLISEGALGNPTRDARGGVERMRTWLSQRLGVEAAEGVPIEPMIVFTHPRVNLTIQEPTITVVHARDSRNEVRRLTTVQKMPGDLARRVELKLLEEARSDGEPVAAGDAVDRKPRKRRPVRAR